MWEKITGKLNNKNIRIIIDWVVIAFAVLTLICNLIPTKCHRFNCALCFIAGFIGFCCLIGSICMLFCNRIKFDWHLVKGNYLAKVVMLVLLFPSIITSFFLIIKPDFSPKNLVYEENLYTTNRVNTDTLGVAKHGLLHDPIFVKAHNLDVINDSTVIQRNKLKDSGICVQNNPSIFWTVYYHFIDPGNQHMTISRSGRGWSALIAILGVFLLNGLLVSSIVGSIDSRKEKWLKGEVKYPCFLRRKKHYVIIGGNDMVPGIVRQIFEKFELNSLPYILIQTSRDVEEFRRELFSTLTEVQQRHIVIFYGSRTSKEDMKHLGLNAAEEIYVLGEETRADDIESYHDTMNMKCLALLQELYIQTPKGREISAKIEQVNAYKEKLSQAEDENTLRNDNNNKRLEEWWKNRPRLNCRVMFEYQTSFSVFQFFDIDESMDIYIKFTPFNYYELWAQNVLINRYIKKQKIKSNFQSGKYLPLEGIEGIKANDVKYVHLFIVGMSRMGVAMAIEAAHLSHYPNFETTRLRTKITFIDKNAAEEKDFFIGRFKELFNLSNWRYGEVCNNNNRVSWHMPHKPSNYRYLGGDFIDIEWEFINGGIESQAIQNYILASANPMAKITIAICLPESNRSHAAALFLDKRIYESNSVLQVLSYNRYGNSIVKAISEGNSEYPFRGKLRSFGCAEQCTVLKYLELSEEIGEYIKDAYAEGKVRYAINPESVYSGKSNAANSWSSIYNGNTLWTKLRCIDFNEDSCVIEQNDINILADVEHNRWNVEELLMNFRYLEEDEQVEVMKGAKKKKDFKKKMAHLDICSNLRLKIVDESVRRYDVLLTKCLGDIYKNLKFHD